LRYDFSQIGESPMTEGFGSIITLLEKQKTAIDRALTALREVGEVSAPTQATPASTATVETPGRKKYKLSAAARERMSQGQQKRYAHLHTVPEPATEAEPTAPGRKGRKRTAAQRRRMAEAQRRRYADLRGESEAAVTPAPEPAKRKISPEGLKRIIAATKKRWRLKRAADQAALEMAEAKKGARKKTAVPAKAA
jgi:hypothetical protein